MVDPPARRNGWLGMGLLLARQKPVVYSLRQPAMCGIVGFLDKSNTSERAAVGKVLLTMLQALACRGPDSAGVALYGPSPDHKLIMRVKLGGRGNLQSRAQQIVGLAESFGPISNFSAAGSYARFLVDEGIDERRLVASVESLDPEIEVVSMGRSLDIVKQVGSPASLERSYAISQFHGTHGLGHTRLSTESRVDLSHSQPFWGHGLPDLAIVHNGHITNYHQLRRKYEQKGVHLHTENDSEIIAVYLAEQLRVGRGLEESLRAMLGDLDGSYSCLAATASQLGFVKDPFALKPLLFAETEDFVAVATEEIAIRSAVPSDYRVREAAVKEVRVWQK
jgi:methylamine---glutamate N-methyltransferase subunit A